jgi:hypothetical protein
VYDAGSSGECFASTEYTELGLSGVLRVESKGAPRDGTYCSHWSEAQLLNELMTGKVTAVSTAVLATARTAAVLATARTAFMCAQRSAMTYTLAATCTASIRARCCDHVVLLDLC